MINIWLYNKQVFCKSGNFSFFVDHIFFWNFVLLPLFIRNALVLIYHYSVAALWRRTTLLSPLLASARRTKSWSSAPVPNSPPAETKFTRSTKCQQWLSMEIRMISFKLYSEAAQERGPVFHSRADLLGHVHNPLPELPQQLRDKRTKYWFSILDWGTSAPVPIYISERWQGMVKMQEYGAKLEKVLQVPSYSQPALQFSQ